MLGRLARVDQRLPSAGPIVNAGGCDPLIWQALLPPAGEDLWVFGYGSLMWRPGFIFGECRPGRIHGFHRALCVRSWVHRGTAECPGLVFGLDRGGSCVGRTFRVAAAEAEPVVRYLAAREMVTPVYRPLRVRVHTPGGRCRALVFVVDRCHPQYVRQPNAQQAAQIVCRARGHSGPNIEYLLSTHQHLVELGIQDPWLEAVCHQLDTATVTADQSPRSVPTPALRGRHQG